ncbi:MAG: zf-HC2 domain-containing protein [Candidatus Sulfotelmatobacter sp.]
MATEKYLLDELPPDLREQFEEHLFDCHECALDVRAASVFLEQGKAVLANPAPTPAPTRNNDLGWFAWMRPAFAVPAFAALLLVIGYQNLVTYPALKSAVSQNQAPQILTAAPLLSSATRGPNAPALTIRQGEPFLLPLDIVPQSDASSYRIELHNPAGGVQWSLVVSSEAARNSLPLWAPGVSEAGQYEVAVVAVNPKGVDVSTARYAFALQFAKGVNPEP